MAETFSKLLDIKATPAEIEKIENDEATKKRWLENAKISSDGKYYIVVDTEYNGYGENLNLRPVYRIVTENYRMRRIGIGLAYLLVEKNLAFEMTKAQVIDARNALEY